MLHYDLFISYAESDKAWVEGYLADALRSAGVHYHSEAAFLVPNLRLGMPASTLCVVFVEWIKQRVSTKTTD